MNVPSMTQIQPPERLLTKYDAAERCQVNLRSVDRWIARGELKVIKLGRSVRITEQAFQKFLKSHGG